MTHYVCAICPACIYSFYKQMFSLGNISTSVILQNRSLCASFSQSLWWGVWGFYFGASWISHSFLKNSENNLYKCTTSVFFYSHGSIVCFCSQWATCHIVLHIILEYTNWCFKSYLASSLVLSAKVQMALSLSKIFCFKVRISSSTFFLAALWSAVEITEKQRLLEKFRVHTKGKI